MRNILTNVKDNLQPDSIVVPEELDYDIPIHQLCLFIDPLDGTGEFVAKRYEAVSCLIGIA